MRFLHEYIGLFKSEATPSKLELASIIEATRNRFDIHNGGDPESAFEHFVHTYNWLGQLDTKEKYSITQNLARNLPGALMQDYLLHLMIKLIGVFPQLDVFTEAKVSFGIYPLWDKGTVYYGSPAEKSDLAVGYLTDPDGAIQNTQSIGPKQPYYYLPEKCKIIPLITVNSKIRVSQSEFFDWLGREQLMTKGNPHCLSVQVALRKEMDISIVKAAQAGHKFFLIGEGGERNVTPIHSELNRFIETVRDHLADRM